MKEITTQELQQWQAEGRAFQLVDVREAWERELYHIGGLHLPLGDLMKRANSLITGACPIVFYCEKGIRSTIAIQRFPVNFHNELYNLKGGMKAWKLMNPQ